MSGGFASGARCPWLSLFGRTNRYNTRAEKVLLPLPFAVDVLVFVVVVVVSIEKDMRYS
jgi:hypothetical protein